MRNRRFGVVTTLVAFTIMLCACASSALDADARTGSPPPVGNEPRARAAAAPAAATPANRAAPPAAAEPSADDDARRELLRRLAPGLSRSTEGLTWQDVGGGIKSLRLRGRFGHASIAVRGPDGALRTSCVDRVESAAAAISIARGAAP